MAQKILASELQLGQKFYMNNCENEHIGKQADMVFYWNHTKGTNGVLVETMEVEIND